MNDSDDIEILRVETLSAERYPLRRFRFAHRRRDGATETLQRELYELPASVAILPVDRERRTVLLVRQFRLPAYVNGDPPRLIEACAGHVEPGEEPAEAARREAEEELGYRLAALSPVLALYTSPGLITEKMYFFLADYSPALRQSAGGGLPGEGEDVGVLELGIDAAWRMVAEGEIIDAKTVVLLQHVILSEWWRAQPGSGQPARAGGGGVSCPGGKL